MTNPLINFEGIVEFSAVKPEHVVPAFEYAISESDSKFKALEANIVPTWNDLIIPLIKIEEITGKIWGPVAHLLSVKNSPELRVAYEEVLPKAIENSLKQSQSKAIYDGLVAIRYGEEWNKLCDSQKRIITLRIRNAYLSGIGLEGDAKERFNEIATEVSKLTTDFTNNVLDATKAFELIITDKKDTENWSSILLNISSDSYNTAKETDESTPENGPWRITLDYPCLGPFMKYSLNREQKELVYKANTRKASSGDNDNTANIANLLKLRHEEAQLLGFKNHAEVNVSVKSAEKVEIVDEKINELYEACYEKAKVEINDLKKFAEENGATDFQRWDHSLWIERLREKLFDYNDEQLRPYFPLPKVLDGLFSLCHKLFGITIESADGEAPIWHEDVTYYKVFDEAGKMVATFYLDPYARPAEKSGGAWMNTYQNRSVINGEEKLPVVYLVCNGTPPSKGQPSLMSFNEVTTLFHEFGHGLQAMLTTVDIPGLSGIGGVEWDAVELASQFMENWCYDKPTLLGMTEHIETGEQLPTELFDKIYASKNFLSAVGMLTQVLYAWTDMELYDKHDPNSDEQAIDVYLRIAEKCATMEVDKDNRFINAFTHIFSGGYHAGYYSYKWSEILSADAFSAFEEVGLTKDQEIEALGRKYRDTVLAMGGSKPALEIFEMFRGRKSSTQPLLRHFGLID